jgi:hypothetical protein
MDTTNQPNTGNQVEPAPLKELALDSLTDQNWLFIKHYLETADIKKSYQLAGYQGTEESAPYQIFKKLKPFVEEIGNLAITSRLKLVADLNKVLSIPLVTKESLTVSEWLRVRKFAASLTPETQSAQKLSVLVVNRYGDNGHKEQDKPINVTRDIEASNIIDIEPIEQ